MASKKPQLAPHNPSMDFAANPLSFALRTREDLAAFVRAEMFAILEDEDAVARFAVALRPHLQSEVRPKGRPSITLERQDHGETAAVIAVARTLVSEKMEAAGVHNVHAFYYCDAFVFAFRLPLLFLRVCFLPFHCTAYPVA